MKKILLMLLSGMLAVACVDEDYDLSNVDSDTVIGDENSEFRFPLATILVSQDEIMQDDTDIGELLAEADVWLPSQLDGGYADIQRLLTDSSYLDELLDGLLAEMLQPDGEKLDAVAELLAEKYLAEFLPLLPAGTTGQTFPGVFVASYADEAFRNVLAAEVRTQATRFLMELRVDDLVYEAGRLDLDDDVIDMLADNLDPKGTSNAKNTLYLYGEIDNRLPVSLSVVPRFLNTDVTMNVSVEACGPDNLIPETQVFAEDLRQISRNMSIYIPVVIEKYYPRMGFDASADHQIIIRLHLVKRGSLKFDF